MSTTRTIARRLLLCAVPAWILWTALLWSAAPQPPAGAAQVVFAVSTAGVLAGCVWACWPALPGWSGRRGRRILNVLLGLAAFVLILLVGHAIGVSIAPQATQQAPRGVP